MFPLFRSNRCCPKKCVLLLAVDKNTFSKITQWIFRNMQFESIDAAQLCILFMQKFQLLWGNVYSNIHLNEFALRYFLQPSSVCTQYLCKIDSFLFEKQTKLPTNTECPGTRCRFRYICAANKMNRTRTSSIYTIFYSMVSNNSYCLNMETREPLPFYCSLLHYKNVKNSFTLFNPCQNISVL